MKEYCVMQFGPKIYNTLHRYNDLVEAKNALFYFLSSYKDKNYRYFVDNDYFKDNIFSPNETNKRFITFTLLEREVTDFEKVQFEEEENSLNEFSILIKNKHLKYYSKKYSSFNKAYEVLKDLIESDYQSGIIPYVDNDFYNNKIINSNFSKYYSLHKRKIKPWKKYYEKETEEKNKIIYFIK